MRTGEQLTDGRTGITVVVLADARETRGAYALIEVGLPGRARARARVPGSGPVPRVELELLHGNLEVEGRSLRVGEQLRLPSDAPSRWLVPPGPGALLLVEVRPAADLRAVVRMLLEPD